MANKYKTPSKEAFVFFAISIGACIYSLIAIISYIENGYIIIRHAQISGIFAYVVIFISIITTIASGYMFKIKREEENE